MAPGAWRRAGWPTPRPSSGRSCAHERIAGELARCFDDVEDLLVELRLAGIATALVTNSAPIGQLAEPGGRRPDLRLRRGGDLGAVRVTKPDPAIFAIALEQLGVTSAYAWHVGDSLSTDVAGAAAGGIRSVWLNRTARARRPGDPTPDLEVATLASSPAGSGEVAPVARAVDGSIAPGRRRCDRLSRQRGRPAARVAACELSC